MRNNEQKQKQQHKQLKYPIKYTPENK